MLNHLLQARHAFMRYASEYMQENAVSEICMNIDGCRMSISNDILGKFIGHDWNFDGPGNI